MSSREQILAAVARNQPQGTPLPQVPAFGLDAPDLVDKFTTVVLAIGGRVFQVADYDEVKNIISQEFPPNQRIISQIPELAGFADTTALLDPERHQLSNVEVALVKAHFGVAENGAVWVTEDVLGPRVVPFIAQHLAVILPKNQILPLMHDAYARIGNESYGYGVFIAGPSKTADIEQSLVLGAHGPRTMTVFLMG